MVEEIRSPVSRPGSKVSGNIPGFSPGAFSDPSRRDRRGDNASQLPEPAIPVSRQSAEPEPPLREATKIVGPED
jgi:hypothetical protein